MRRDVGFVLESGTPAFVKALDDAVIAIMIEKASAVENLEALLSVKGVDMVQFGPADYSMSIGLPGQFRHPKVKEAERYVIETALKMGMHPRAEISHPDHAKEYLDMGVRHFCIGIDVDDPLRMVQTQRQRNGQPHRPQPQRRTDPRFSRRRGRRISRRDVIRSK